MADALALIALLVGAALGAGVMWFICASRTARAVQEARTESAVRVADLEATIRGRDEAGAALRADLADAEAASPVRSSPWRTGPTPRRVVGLYRQSTCLLVALLLLLGLSACDFQSRCPRCGGDGWVGEDDIARQNKTMVWSPGRCDQCQSSGEVVSGWQVGGTTLLGIGCVLAVLLPVYFLPTWLAYRRGHVYAGPILALNVLGGWTVIAWVIALAWALWPGGRTIIGPVLSDPTGETDANVGGDVGRVVAHYRSERDASPPPGERL